VGYAYGMDSAIAWYGANTLRGLRPSSIAALSGVRLGLLDHDQLQCDHAAVLLVEEGAPEHDLRLVLSLFVNVGIGSNGLSIICTSLARDFLPSSWGYFSPTIVDIFTFFGTFGVFSVLFLLFIRFLPLMAMAETESRHAPGRPPRRQRPGRRPPWLSRLWPDRPL